MIAALFVQPDGIYADHPKVDLWDEARDARKYQGPWPVIAHPPCQRWGKMALVNYSRWGGQHNLPGNDGGCFEFALNAVRAWGGVLEHPAMTMAWQQFDISRPLRGPGWQLSSCGGWVCEVWQSAYGHKAAKATWLYYQGDNPPIVMRWARKPGSHQVGGCDRRGKAKNKPTLSIKEANATPVAFRDALIALAKNCSQKPLDARGAKVLKVV